MALKRYDDEFPIIRREMTPEETIKYNEEHLPAPTMDSGRVLYAGTPREDTDAQPIANPMSGAQTGASRPKTPGLNGDALYDRYKDIYDSQKLGVENTPSLSADDMRGQVMELLQKVRGGTFNYDLNSDPLYLQARDAYMSQGQLNAKNVAAQAAAYTGGYGNSYGTVAAQQQMNQAASDLNAIVPDLYNNAYNRWQQGQERDLQLMSIYNNLANEADDRAWNEELRGRQRTEWGQADEDRARNNAWEDETRGQTRKDWDYTNWLNEFNKGRAGIEAEQNDKLFDQNYRWNDVAHAMSIGQSTGDWSGMRDLGYDPSAMEFGQKLSDAMSIFSATGDASRLKALGIDTSSAEAKAALEEAIKYANLHDYSKLKALGIPTDYFEMNDQYDMWKINQAYLAAAGYGSGSSGSGSSGGGGSSSGATPTSTPITSFDEAVNYALGDERGDFYAVGGKATTAGTVTQFKNKKTGEVWQFRKNTDGTVSVNVGSHWERITR